MALSIKNEEADRLARELAGETGESLTEAVTRSLQERLIRVRSRREPGRLRDVIREIRDRCAELPVRDGRSPDEIIGYDERGLPS
ncbi:MAG: type II toxin-antitoxin system VapB family antitoxin [Gemmatimonadetes bacterium]|nr:type II toxin-antitoxin system VapB family antitoxin [Gemmatimonadota bacterium]